MMTWLTLFSTELPWCCFCAEIKVLGMERNFTRIFLYNKREFPEPRTTGGGTWLGTTHQGAPPPLGAPRWVVPTWWPRRPWNRWYKSHFSRKNQGERIILFHETEPPSPPVLHREARSGVRLGLRRGRSSIFVITNPSPSPIPWCSPPGVSNSFVGSLVGEELDKIHHVI